MHLRRVDARRPIESAHMHPSAAFWVLVSRVAATRRVLRQTQGTAGNGGTQGTARISAHPIPALDRSVTLGLRIVRHPDGAKNGHNVIQRHPRAFTRLRKGPSTFDDHLRSS